MPDVSPASAAGAAPLLSVRDLKALEGSQSKTFAAVLVLRRLTVKTASNGNPFLSLELGDRHGSFSCTVFGDSPVYDQVKDLAEGSPVRVEGRVEHYQGRLSPRLHRLDALDERELETTGALADLVEVAPADGDQMWAEFQAYVASITHPELRAAVMGVFDEIGPVFRVCPAAVAMHHAYRHGLLEHTLRMARACRALLPLYPEVDGDLALAGILLHDTGKTIEYEGSLATRRSRRGQLQGHVVLGYQLARKHGMKARLDAERLERLEHIVLSHQGEPEWGAAVYAATPEAVFVSMIDNLDAKMGMVQRALRQSQPGDEFSERLPGLNGPLLVRPVPAGAGETTPGGGAGAAAAS